MRWNVEIVELFRGEDPLEGVGAFCTSIRGAMAEPSFAVQQKMLQLVVNRIVVEDNRVIIEHVVPTGPVRLQTEQQACQNLR
jgi:site-specific DNA recombinase